MTAPIQEPTPGRTDQSLEWKTRQLFRRPAPVAAGSVYHNPAINYELSGTDWWFYYDDGNRFIFAPVRDSTAPSGNYFQSNSAFPNAYFIVGCPLGPAGSRWAVDMWWSKGPDYGMIDLEWQTTPGEVTGFTSETIGGAITSPSGGTWYKAGTSATAIDAYAAADSDTAYDTQLNLITPTGADGDMLTADGTSSSIFTATADMNGGGDGSVWWWLRVKVASKNASSSGYKCRIHSLRIRRVAEDGWALG